MARKSRHVVPDTNGGWSVKSAGTTRAIKRFDTQAEAIDWARRIAQSNGGELVIHRQDGTIRSKDSYGNDPYPPKDKHH
jgi:hypothetical protein